MKSDMILKNRIVSGFKHIFSKYHGNEKGGIEE